MKNVIHLDSDFTRNTCNQICANVQSLLFFSLLRFRNTLSCRPGTVGGIEGKKLRLNILLVTNGMLLVTANRTKSWNNNNPNLCCIFQTNVSSTTQRHWCSILCCVAMRRAWRILDATHVHIVPLDAIFTHARQLGKNHSNNHHVYLSGQRIAALGKHLSEKRTELNISAQRYHVVSMYLWERERERVRRENEF